MSTGVLARFLLIFLFAVMPVNHFAVELRGLDSRVVPSAAWADDEDDAFDSDDEIDNEEDDQINDEIDDEDFEEAEEEEVEDVMDDIMDEMDDEGDDEELAEDEEEDEDMDDQEVESAQSEGGQVAEDAEVDNALRS